MQRQNIILFLAAIFSTAYPLRAADKAANETPRKLALVVGISRYERSRPQPPDWWNLNTQNDVAAIKQVLIERFGYSEKDILTLAEEKATRQGISDAFEKHLIAQARPGDIVVFHYSGHGQQIPDDNGDEMDGLDESLVPFDYISQSAQDGAKSNLRDDQMGDLLARLQKKMQGPDGKVVGNITLFMDCCFSGTATRGTPPEGRLIERGRGWNEKLDGPINAVPRPATRGKEESASGLLEHGEAQTQGYVIISASDSNQTAKETKDEQGRPVGVFTYHLTRGLNQAMPGTTYRALFERLNVEVNGSVRDQNPQLEGEIDKLLLADAALPAPRYIVARAVAGDDITLPVGELHSVTAGSRYAIYAAGTDVKDEKNRIAEAEIITVDATSSTARLTPEYSGKVKEEALIAARAVETAHNYGESSLKVWIEEAGDWSKPLQELEVATREGVTKDNYDVLIRRANGQLTLQRKDGSLLAQIKDDAEAADKMNDALLGEWRWRFLSQLRSDDPNAVVKVDLRVVPVKVETDSKGQVKKVLGDREDVETTEGNRLIIREGDFVMIELRNPSEVAAYVTVVDLSPDGSISPIFPHPLAPQDNKIPPDKQWHRIPAPFVFRMGRPFGTEVFKAIATREPTDFSPLLYQKTAQEINERGGPSNPIGKLLLTASTGKRKRGAGFAGVPPAVWATDEAPFEIRPK